MIEPFDRSSFATTAHALAGSRAAYRGALAFKGHDKFALLATVKRLPAVAFSIVALCFVYCRRLHG